jgi:hypothetical protein
MSIGVMKSGSYPFLFVENHRGAVLVYRQSRQPFLPGEIIAQLCWRVASLVSR